MRRRPQHGGAHRSASLEGPRELPAAEIAPGWSKRLDPTALEAALVLVPASYSRNRFHALYDRPAARRARRRAALLRGVAADLLRGVDDLRVEQRAGRVTLHYRLAELGVRRTTVLDPDEVVLVAQVLARSLCASKGDAVDPRSRAARRTLEAAAGPGAAPRLRLLLDRLYADR